MAGQNRHLFGNTNTVYMSSPGSVEVESGDFMYLSPSRAGMACPFDFELPDGNSGTSILEIILDRFIGVALQGKPSGVTEKISIASGGIYRYPLYGSHGSVTAGLLVTAVTNAVTSTAGTVSPQCVALSTDSSNGTTAYIGIIHRSSTSAEYATTGSPAAGSGVSYVDFRIVSRLMSGVSIGPIT